jgi:hypothetical protein
VTYEGFFLVDKSRVIDMGIFDIYFWRFYRLLHNEGGAKNILFSKSFNLRPRRSEDPCFHSVLVRAWMSEGWSTSTEWRSERNG